MPFVADRPTSPFFLIRLIRIRILTQAGAPNYRPDAPENLKLIFILFFRELALVLDLLSQVHFALSKNSVFYT